MPAPLVMAIRRTPVAMCDSSTEAPPTTPPDGSVTVPVTVPRLVCASARTASRRPAAIRPIWECMALASLHVPAGAGNSVPRHRDPDCGAARCIANLQHYRHVPAGPDSTWNLHVHLHQTCHLTLHATRILNHCRYSVHRHTHWKSRVVGRRSTQPAILTGWRSLAFTGCE